MEGWQLGSLAYVKEELKMLVTIPTQIARSLLTNDFDQHTFLSPAIKLTIKDLLPGPEVQLASCDCNDNLASHHLSFDVRVGIVLAGLVVMIAANGFVWRELFEPGFVIVMQSAFVVIDEDRRGDVHGIYQH